MEAFEKLCLLLFLLQIALPLAKGYVYWIVPKYNDSETYPPPYYCYTNESDSGVAFVGHLSEDFLDRNNTGKVKYTSIWNETYFEEGEGDCNLVEEGKCGKWDLKEFDRISNLDISILDISNDFQLPPVVDRRWNDLPVKEILQSGDVHSLVELENSAEGVMHLSVLAIQTTIVFTRSSDSGDEFCIALDDFSETHRIEQWSNNRTKIVTLDTKELKQKLALNLGRLWTLLSIHYKLRHSSISLEIIANNRTILQIQDFRLTKYTYRNTHSSWRVTASGKYNLRHVAYYKLHKYDVLRPQTNSPEIRREIAFSSKRTFCLDVTYFSQGGRIYTTVKNDNKETTKAVEFSGSSSVWETKRIAFESEKGKYTISIKASNQSLIGDIRFCVSGPELVETWVWPLHCGSMKRKFDRRSFSRDDNGLEPAESAAVCKVVSKGACEGISYCFHTYEVWNTLWACACFSGYLSNEDLSKGQMCDASCASANKFGTNCKHNFQGKCIDNKYNIHSGFCTNGCKDNFEPPMCTKRTLEFEVLPIRVTEIGPYTALVDFHNAIDQLKEHQTREKQNFYFFDVQIRKLEGSGIWSNWETVRRLHNFGSSFEVPLKNLQHSSKYQVVGLVGENMYWNERKKMNLASFETTGCTTLVLEDLEVVTKKGTFPKVKKLSNDPNLCKVTKIRITRVVATKLVDVQNTSQIAEKEAFKSANEILVLLIYSDDGNVLTFEEVAEKDLELSRLMFIGINLIIAVTTLLNAYIATLIFVYKKIVIPFLQ